MKDALHSDMVRFSGVLRDVTTARPLKVAGDGRRCYLQVCPSGRKWWLSTHMTDSEVVRTAFMAVLAYEEHEVREAFLWRGARVFGPHLDLEALASIAGREDRRRGEDGSWETEDR